MTLHQLTDDEVEALGMVPDDEYAASPCPFCGDDTELEVRDEPNPFRAGEKRFFMTCDCGARGPSRADSEDAHGAWNSRVYFREAGDRHGREAVAKAAVSMMPSGYECHVTAGHDRYHARIVRSESGREVLSIFETHNGRDAISIGAAFAIRLRMALDRQSAVTPG